MSRVEFGTMTTEQTKEVAIEAIGYLKDEDIIEVVVNACRDDEALTDELYASLDQLSFD